MDAEYFESYGIDISVHHTMLLDASRMAFYQAALCRERVANKVVVDVGAGTGILSLWAARNGAKHVFAVEASELASQMLQTVVERNGFSSVIHVVHAAVEDIKDPQALLSPYGCKHVDVIVSEWMGFYLLHEAMLPSIVHARKLFSGTSQLIVLPNRATIYAAPVNLDEYFSQRCHDRFWSSVDGFDLSVYSEAERQHIFATSNPLVDVIPASSLLCEPKPIATFDINRVEEEELDSVRAKCVFNFRTSPVCHQFIQTHTGDTFVSGFAVWFAVECTDETPRTLQLSTSPLDPPTHWKQTVVLLPSELQSAINVSSMASEGRSGGDCGDAVGVNFSFERGTERSRAYELSIELFDPAD